MFETCHKHYISGESMKYRRMPLVDNKSASQIWIGKIIIAILYITNMENFSVKSNKKKHTERYTNFFCPT